VIEGAVKTITLATPEQLEELKRLLETVRVAEDFESKCFARVGASKWSEFEQGQMTQIINHLKGKMAA
jgi:hypothetical protein